MSKRTRKVKVVYRRLGRERAWGLATCDPASPTIELDSRLGAKRLLETTCHEICHLIWPDKPEREIDRAGKYLCKVLWAQDYRRVLLQANSKPPRIT